MPRTPDRNSNGRNSNNGDGYGRDTHYDNHPNPFYQGDRDEGRARPENRPYRAGERSDNQRYNQNGSRDDYRGLSNAAHSDRYESSVKSGERHSQRFERPSHDGYGGDRFDTGAPARDDNARYGSGRYATDYDNQYTNRPNTNRPSNAGYTRRDREEYNRFDQDHDEHGYSHRGRAWSSGESLNSERSHGNLYGSTYGEPDQGRSRFTSADDHWHLPNSGGRPEHDRERYRSSAAPQRRYGTRYTEDEYEDGRLPTDASYGQGPYGQGWRNRD